MIQKLRDWLSVLLGGRRKQLPIIEPEYLIMGYESSHSHPEVRKENPAKRD